MQCRQPHYLNLIASQIFETATQFISFCVYQPIFICIPFFLKVYMYISVLFILLFERKHLDWFGIKKKDYDLQTMCCFK